MRTFTSLAGIAAVTTVIALSVTGCSANQKLAAANAYLPVPTTPGSTVAYLEIRNNGGANELIGASTSAGGTVSLRAPVTRGTQVMTMRSVPDIPVPKESTVHLAPNGYHLLVTGAHGLRGGQAITLRLTFAHGGTISVVALVTDPQSGGSSYFLN